MLPTSLAVQLSFASVDRGDGSDPRADAADVLRTLRVPAAVRDATAAWSGQEAVLAVPVTEDGRVLSLDADDRIVATLTGADVRTAFADAGMTLWLTIDDDADAAVPLHPAVEPDPDEVLAEELSPALVRVDSFSHRGPAMARVTAQLQRASVEYREEGVWSMQSFSTADPSTLELASGADLPVIELSRTADGGSWVDVTVGSGTVPFWTDAERDTQPVLDLDAITVPETAEFVRRLLIEGDGTRDDLRELAAAVDLDIDAAHAALVAEAFGGVVGSEARQRAFLAAFGVPDALLDAAFGEAASSSQRIAPAGWGVALREILIDGVSSLTPLTRRDRPLARIDRALQARPVLGMALSATELTAGAVLTRVRGIGRVLGILLIADAVIDLVIWVVRARRRR